MGELRQDLRYAFRGLLKDGGFTVIAILTIGIGIGANATVFGWMRALLLNPLPGAAEPGRIVAVESVAPNGDPLTTSFLDYRDLRDHLDRINAYTTLAARQMHESGRRATVLDIVVHPPAAFLRNYLLRRGFLDGGVGLTLSAVNAYSVFLKFAKLWEMQHSVNSQLPTSNSQREWVPTLGVGNWVLGLSYFSIPFAFNTAAVSGADRHLISAAAASACAADFPIAAANETGC